MKRYFTAYMFILLANLFSCTSLLKHGRIVVYSDDYIDTTVLTMDLYNLREYNSYTKRDSFPVVISFSRAFVQKQKRDISVIFLIQAKENAKALRDIMFFKINEEKINFVIFNKSTEEMHYQPSGVFTYLPQTKNPDTQNYTINKEYIRTSYIKNWTHLKGEIKLSNEIEQKISGCESLVFRLYSGNTPVTYRMDETNLKLIKKFIGTVPNEKTTQVHYYNSNHHQGQNINGHIR